jgi:hypothetical protein
LTIERDHERTLRFELMQHFEKWDNDMAAEEERALQALQAQQQVAEVVDKKLAEVNKAEANVNAINQARRDAEDRWRQAVKNAQLEAERTQAAERRAKKAEQHLEQKQIQLNEMKKKEGEAKVTVTALRKTIEDLERDCRRQVADKQATQKRLSEQDALVTKLKAQLPQIKLWQDKAEFYRRAMERSQEERTSAVHALQRLQEQYFQDKQHVVELAKKARDTEIAYEQELHRDLAIFHASPRK